MKSEFFNVRLTPETEVVIQIIHLLDSAFVYVGGEDGKLSNATVAIQTKFVKHHKCSILINTTTSTDIG